MNNQVAQAAQTVPYKVNFQGRLTDASGNPKANGLYNIRFRLFSVASGGAAVWTETRETTNRVQVTNGLFSVQLGDVSALSPSVFTNYPLYLEVELPTPVTSTCSTAACASWAEGAMTPRSPLGAAPYAFNADTVDGIDAASLAQLGADNTFSGNNTLSGSNTFSGNLTVASSAAIGFNMYHNGTSHVLQNAGTGSWLSQSSLGLTIHTTPSGNAGDNNGSSRPTMSFLDNGVFDATIDGGLTYGDNLQSNPGFEYQNNGWADHLVTSTASPRSGKSHQRYTMANSTSFDDFEGRMISARPGDRIYAEVYVKTSVATTGQGGAFLAFYDADGNVLSYANGDWTNPGTSYVLRTIDSVAPANTAYVGLATTVRGVGATTGGTWDFDDIYVQKVNRINPVSLQNTVNSTEAFGIRSASGALLLAADTTNMALLIGGGDSSPDDSPALLVVDNKSGSGDPTGRNGAIYYNASSKKFRCYEDGAWKDCIANPNARSNFYYASDLMGTYSASGSGALVNHPDGISLSFTNGTGAAVTTPASEAGRSGLLRGSTGTTTSGNAGINSVLYNGGSVYAPVFFGNGAWTFSSAVRMPIVSDGTQTYMIRSGFMDVGAANDACYLFYSSTVNSGKWLGVCRASNVESNCDTGLAVTASTWYNTKIAVNSSGTAAVFVVNDTYTCTVTSNIPTAAVGWQVGIIKSAGTTARTLDVDYLEVTGSGLSR